MHRSADYWIKHLQLVRHPEGGYYSEVYRSSEQIPQSGLPPRFSGARSMATSIFFLLEAGDFSAFHRIRSDETWHFYDGQPLEIHELHSAVQSYKGQEVEAQRTEHQVTLLGRDVEQGERLQWTVPAGVWFASRPRSLGVPPGSSTASRSTLPPGSGATYSLVGCTVSPGFDFADFEMARRSDLLEQFPQYAPLIAELTQIN